MKKQKDLSNINTYLIVALVIVVAIGLYFTLSVPTVKKEAEQPILAKQLTLTLVGADCKDCFNVSVAVDFIKQQPNINVTEVKEISLEDATDTIAKYNLSRLPALLISGEIANLTIPNFETREDSLVFDKAPAPYYDVASKKVKGKVSLIVLEDASCKDCFDMNAVVAQLKQAGVKIVTEQKVDAKSDEGKQLISTYKIEKVPTLLFNKEAMEYDVISQVWGQVGTEESDGKLVLRFVNPPYVNVTSGKTEGMVNLIYLMDESCAECYNATVLKELFQQSFNMYFKGEETIDVTSTKGKMMVKKYAIEAVPTVVLSKEATVYPNFAAAWNSAGTEEKDGAFVFRQVSLLKDYFAQSGGNFSYKNLTSGEILSGTSAPEAITEEAEITIPSEEE